MKSTVVAITLAAAAGLATAQCNSMLYGHCTHYVKNDNNGYIKCDTKNPKPCGDMCNHKMDKCGNAWKQGSITVGCWKLAGNLYAYCMSFDTSCKSAKVNGLLTADEYLGVMEVGPEDGYPRDQVPLSELYSSSDSHTGEDM